MRGLRTQEEKKFEKFFEHVQDEAQKKKAVFFLDCGQGKTFENSDVECEDLCGWLIPDHLAEKFEKVFNDNGNEKHDFDDFYAFVDFSVTDNGEISIFIDDTPNGLSANNFNTMKDIETQAK